MRTDLELCRRAIAVALMLLLTGPAIAQEASPVHQSQSASVANPSAKDALPDSPEPAGARAAEQQGQPAAPQPGHRPRCAWYRRARASPRDTA